MGYSHSDNRNGKSKKNNTRKRKKLVTNYDIISIA
jgi:hypothetical protein